MLVLVAVLFNGGKKWVASRDPEALQRFFNDRSWLALGVIVLLIVMLVGLALLPLLSL